MAGKAGLPGNQRSKAWRLLRISGEPEDVAGGVTYLTVKPAAAFDSAVPVPKTGLSVARHAYRYRHERAADSADSNEQTAPDVECSGHRLRNCSLRWSKISSRRRRTRYLCISRPSNPNFKP